jgi:hypothetical protein
MAGIGTQWANAVRAMSRATVSAPSWFDADLSWYANEREGDLGLRGVPIEQGIGGDPEVHDGVSDHQVRAATRARLIDLALGRLHSDTRILLLAVHFRLSPRAHKDKHRAQERCIERRQDEIAVAVAIFRGALARGPRC